MRLDGKVSLITGAATGIQGELMGFGGTAAWLFVREGSKVVLGDIDDERGMKTASQIRESGGNALFVHLDVTKEQDWVRAVATTVSKFGKLDILINNAGTSAGRTLEDTTEEIWDGQMDVHAKGAFWGIKHAVVEMRRSGGGSIINISSIWGIVGSPTSTPYHVAKGAVRILSKSAAIQYAGDNIRVNSIHPGPMITPMSHRSFSQPERRKWWLDRIPLGIFGNADDIANGLLYLASDESSYVTGSELVIDGGYTAQ